MSKKCKAYSESRLGLQPADNRKAFYAGWDAALRQALEESANSTADVVESKALSQPEQYDQTALELCEKCGWKGIIPDEGCLVCARKNQKPVAWLNITDEGERYIQFAGSVKDFNEGTKFYTAPPKREWVGLTDEEAWGVYRTHGLSFHRPNHVEENEWALCMRDFARAIEAKLKEKNT